jgi:hypothetical protein
LFGVRQRELLFLAKWNELPGPADDLRCVRVGPVHAIALVLHVQLGQMELRSARAAAGAVPERHRQLR